MHLLPRGKIVKELLRPSRLKMPDALMKMCANRFSGYLSFEAEQSGGVLCYAEGKITAAMWQTCGVRLCGEAALEMLFHLLQLDECLMSIYRLDTEFVPYLQRYCQGRVECQGQQMALLDIERLLAYLQQPDFSGCLRLTGNERIVMIFYTNGKAQGFFCDGDTRLATTVDLSGSVTADPHCQLDIVRTQPGDEQAHFVGAVNLEKNWLKVWRELNL